jgi:hypothetical protein
MNECGVPIMERIFDIITNPVYYSNHVAVISMPIDIKDRLVQIKWTTPLDSTEKQLKFQQHVQIFTEVFSFVGGAGFGASAINLDELINDAIKAYSLNRDMIDINMFTRVVNESMQKAEMQQDMALNTAEANIPS